MAKYTFPRLCLPLCHWKRKKDIPLPFSLSLFISFPLPDPLNTVCNMTTPGSLLIGSNQEHCYLRWISPSVMRRWNFTRSLWGTSALLHLHHPLVRESMREGGSPIPIYTRWSHPDAYKMSLSFHRFMLLNESPRWHQMHFKFCGCIYIEDLDILVLFYIGKIVLSFSIDLYMKENN